MFMCEQKYHKIRVFPSCEYSLSIACGLILPKNLPEVAQEKTAPIGRTVDMYLHKTYDGYYCSWDEFWSNLNVRSTISAALLESPSTI